MTSQLSQLYSSVRREGGVQNPAGTVFPCILTRARRLLIGEQRSEIQTEYYCIRPDHHQQQAASSLSTAVAAATAATESTGNNNYNNYYCLDSFPITQQVLYWGPTIETIEAAAAAAPAAAGEQQKKLLQSSLPTEFPFPERIVQLELAKPGKRRKGFPPLYC